MGFLSTLAGLIVGKKVIAPSTPKVEAPVVQTPAAPAANPQNSQEQVINTDTTGMTLKRKAAGKKSLTISLGNNSGGGAGAGLNL